MKSTLLLACIIASNLFVLINAQTSKYDNFDVDILLRNDRILNNYIKCLIDKGPCTNDGRELKRNLPVVLETTCSKCTDKQRRNTRKLIHHLETKKPELFKEVQAKYDPTGQHLRMFKALKV